MSKKIYFSFLIAVIYSHFSFGQKQVVIDSLETALKTANQDTAKIHVLNSLAKEYQKTEPEKAMQYAQQALKMAESLLPLKKLDNELKGQHIESRIKKGIADAFYIIAQVYDEQGNYEFALKDYFRSLDIRQKIEDKKGISYCYNGIGSIYEDQGKYEDALKMHTQSFNIKKNINDKKGMSNSYSNIGRVFEKQGSYSKALEIHFLALKIRQELGDNDGISSSYMNIANIYILQKKFDEALTMNLEAMQLIEESKNKIKMMRVCNDIGVIYRSKKEYDQAINYYLRGMKVAEEQNNKQGIAFLLINIGNVMADKKSYKEATQYLIKALKASEELSHKEAIIACLANLGEVYGKQNMNDLSLYYLDKALTLSKEIGYKNGIRECYSNLAERHSKMNNYKKAFDYQELYTKINDSILNEASLKQINEMKTKYETEKKEKEIELLSKDKKLKEIQFHAEIKQQTTLRNFFIGGFVLVLLLASVSIMGYRQKIRSNAIIALKNEEISKQKANITGQEEERKRIAKELHDGIGGTLAGIKLNLIRISSSPDNIPELESVITNIGDACKEIRTISHNLAPPSLSNSSLIETMKDVIGKFVIPGKMDIRFEYFPEDELNQVPVNIHADIYRITQELLHNIVKHSQANMVEIDLSKEGDYLYLLVEDNGIGFDIGSVKKGIGLKNIESRVNLLNGKMIIDSKIGRGTAMNIHIPITGELTNTNFS